MPLARALLKAIRTASVASYLAAVFEPDPTISRQRVRQRIPPRSPRPAVQVIGNHLADGEGSPIRLIGVNRSGSEYACITEGLGVFDGPTGKRAIAAMKTWRINAVRVPLNEDCWLGINGAPAEYSAARYHEAVKELRHPLARGRPLRHPRPALERAGRQAGNRTTADGGPGPRAGLLVVGRHGPSRMIRQRLRPLQRAVRRQLAMLA